MGIRDLWAALWSGQDQSPDESPRKYDVIGSLDGHEVGRNYNVIGDPDAAKAHEYYEDHSDDFRTERLPESEQYMDLVDPNTIEGIRMSGARAAGPQNFYGTDGASIADPDAFWGMRGRSREDYLDLTSHIPEINAQLEGKTPEEQGEVLDALRDDPELGACVNYCYMPQNRVKAWKMGDIYELDEDGCHRVLAARENMESAREDAQSRGEEFDESKYYLPVQVVASLTPSEALDESNAINRPEHSEWSGCGAERSGEAQQPDLWYDGSGANRDLSEQRAEANDMRNDAAVDGEARSSENAPDNSISM